jgi:hypothetical protein
MRWNKAIILLVSLMIMLSLTAVVFAKDPKGDGKDKVISKPSEYANAILDINNIECWVMNEGSFGTNPTTGGDGFYFPKGQRTLSIIFTSGLWFLGKVDGEVRSAVNCYGTEFQPGPMIATDTPGDPLDPAYSIWKYNKGDVIDASATALGCPDEVMGDQMIFYVCNDYQSHEHMWKTPPMGLELQHTVFGFNRTGALGNTVFQRLRLINKSSNDFDECYIGYFYDPDLGWANDDYTGCDPDLGIAYVYNGDGFDEKYGVEVPAMASDFFQGPIVPAPGETATLPDGTVIPDHEILPMTAYFCYINGSPIEGMEDPYAAGGNAHNEAYYFVRGYLNQGDEWMDPSSGTPTATKFPFSGDPVAGTGWLFSDISVPDDIRMGNASGPFDMAMGDTQDVVIGNVVGLGTDNLSSITVMKFYDAAAQQAYDMNFELPEPPPQPVVNVTNMDTEAAIYWNTDAITFDQDGYAFQGYNIYQGEGVAGPWTKIATFDIADGITVIWDLAYSTVIGALIEMPMQQGSDTGVQNAFFIEKDYLRNVPLVNGRPYYFAVTGYAYNPTGVPKILENAATGVEVIPQRPVLDTQWNADIGDVLTGTPSIPSDGICNVIINDPSAVTGDDYEVSFSEDTDPDSPYFGDLVYDLTNVTTGEVLLAGKPQGGLEGGYETTEGLEVQVAGPASGLKDIVEVAYAGTAVDPPDNVFHSLNSNATYFFNFGGGGGAISRGERYITYAEPDDFEMRFTEDGGWLVFAFENDLIRTVPFEIWRIGSGTPDDASDDVRMVPFMYSNVAPNTDGGTDTGHEPTWGYPCSDWIYWMDAEGDDGYDNFAAQCATTGAGNTYPYATDGSTDGYWADFHGGFVYPIGRSLICDYDLGGAWPPAGTTIRLTTKKPITEDLVFSFSTAQYKADKNADVAKERLDDINVFPNPYFGHNSAEGDYYSQFVTFNNLPETCTIRIFTLSGQLVNTLEHKNATPFERWYLQNREEIPCASGVYIVHITTDFGDKILKIAVINREAIYQHI